MTISAAGYTAINAIPSTTDQLYVYNDQKGPNLTNIYAFNPSSVRGSSWNVSGVAAMIKGFSYWGDSLSAAIAGYSFQDYDGSAAVIGARHDGTGAGFLGYFNGTTQYGVYTPSTVPARIGGNIEVYGAIMPNGLAGTAGQVLTSAGAGVPATWAAAGSGSGWQLTGNGGTTAGTNFVGTTDLVDLVFKTNGAENMRILNTSGRVGIGTTAPNKKFHVVGDSRFEGYTTLNNNFYHLAESTTSIAYHLAGISPTNLMEFGDFSSPYLTRFNLSSFSATNGLGFFSTAQSYFMYLDGVNGRVGIGTTAPNKKFHVVGDSRFQGYTTLNNNFYHLAESTTSIAYHLAGISPTNLMEFGDFSSPYLTRFNLSSFSATNGLGFFSTAQSYFMYLDGVNGRVGIGTTAPNKKFHVVGDSRFEGYTTLNNNFYHLAESTTSIAYHLAGISPTNLMEFGDFSSPYLTRFNLSSFSATNGLGFFSTAQSYFMYLDGVNGRVGIGTTAPAHRLELSVDDAAKPGGGSWTVASDKRLKQNIKPYTEGLSKLLLVEPIEYNYNERSGYDTKPSYVGVVAQDLQKIAPYMVGKFKKNGEEYLDVNTSAMTYMMVNAIKEQQKMIEDLKKEIEALKKK